MKTKKSSPSETLSISKIPRFMRELWDMIRSNIGSTALFVLLYSVVNAIVTPTAINMLLSLALKANGTTYLGPDNLSKVLLSPVTILLTIPALILIILPPIFEVSGILHAFSMGKIGKKTSLGGMIGAGFYACRRSIIPKNWPVILYFAVLIPLTGVFAFTSGNLSLAIPEFIRDFISANGLYNKLYTAAYIILLVLQLSFIFVLNFYSLEEKSFIASCRESWRIIRKKRLRTVVWMLATTLTFYIISVATSAVISEIIIKLSSPFVGSSGSLTDAYRITGTMAVVRNMLAGVVAPVINLSAVTVMFYEYVEEDRGLVRVSPRAFNDTKITVGQMIASVLVVVLFVGLAFGTGQFFIDTHDATYQPQLFAHRGDSVRAPENTMAAFSLAALEGTDGVELDVHQTKDGVIVVSHDDDLTRVSGKKLFVHDLTYAEIQELDTGSWFDPEFSYIRLSTLDEVLKFFKEYDTDLQIEIKPTEFDVELEKQVVDLIKKNGMQDHCMIISLDLDTLLKVEEIDSSIVTGYAMFVAWERIEDVPVDFLTVEESNVSRKLVRNVHNAGKKIFAWTANTEDTVQYLYDCGVDGILTDDPIMLGNALDKIHKDGGIVKALRMGIERLVRGH